MSFRVTRNATYFATVLDGEIFQIVAMADEDFLPFGIASQIADTIGKCCHPDTSLAIFIDAINVVVRQAVDIVGTITIARQFITKLS